ncbi:hypothetical protein U9M48_005289 [Paspalum notatum var. saurae]|uniref:Uncharacterized protein n=1 Tax=Paspalum notatum var. saurae TaxID=547442 RepID=A0AAQ3SFD4_PASNO
MRLVHGGGGEVVDPAPQKFRSRSVLRSDIRKGISEQYRGKTTSFSVYPRPPVRHLPYPFAFRVPSPPRPIAPPLGLAVARCLPAPPLRIILLLRIPIRSDSPSPAWPSNSSFRSGLPSRSRTLGPSSPVPPWPPPLSCTNRHRQVHCPSPFILPNPRKSAPNPPKKRQRPPRIRVEGRRLQALCTKISCVFYLRQKLWWPSILLYALAPAYPLRILQVSNCPSSFFVLTTPPNSTPRAACHLQLWLLAKAVVWAKGIQSARTPAQQSAAAAHRHPLPTNITALKLPHHRKYTNPVAKLPRLG